MALANATKKYIAATAEFPERSRLLNKAEKSLEKQVEFVDVTYKAHDNPEDHHIEFLISRTGMGARFGS